MKKFIKYCLVFSIPFWVSLVTLEYNLRQVPNPYKYKYDWMQKNADDVETLIFGSSHTFYGIRPEFIDGKAFSLANVSQGLRQDLFLLEYWADRYKKLKTIIVPISFYSWFSKGLEHGSEAYRCRYYKIYMDCDLYSDFSLYNLEISDYRTAQGKLDKIRSHETDPGCNEYGWGKTYTLASKDLLKWENGKEASAAVERHTAKSWDYIEDNLMIMRKIAQFCKNRNIQLILITTPCWHTYYDNLDKEQLSKMYELTYQFQKESGALYFDFLRDKRFEADDFFDSNHLSDVGAVKFTKILNSIMQ